MTKILFGDSLSWGTDQTLTNYTQRLSKRLETLLNDEVKDLSFAGMRLCRAVDNTNPFYKFIGAGLLDSINILDRLPTGVDVLIFLGVNDINNGTPLLTIKSEMKAVVERTKALGDNPIIISPPPRYNVDPATDMYAPCRDAYASIALAHDITHISGAAIIDYTYADLYALPDDQHLSALGHQHMADSIYLMMGW